jgi:GT2 family glycosyltransferase
VVVDNASADGSPEALQRRFGDRIEMIRNEANLGFASACRQAMSRVRERCVLLLNPDCLLPPDAIERLAGALAAHPEYGLVAPRVLDAEGLEQSGSRRRLPTPWRLLRYALGQHHVMDLRDAPLPPSLTPMPAVSGACMMLRQSAWQQVGGMDPGYFLHFEDLDLMHRMQDHGWLVGLLPDLEVRHVGGRSSRARPLFVSRCKHAGLQRYLRRHHRWHPLTWTLLPLLNWGHYLLDCLRLRRTATD